jgi:hypothetical protein
MDLAWIVGTIDGLQKFKRGHGQQRMIVWTNKL